MTGSINPFGAQLSSRKPLCNSYATLLHNFARTKDLKRGQTLHAELIKLGLLCKFPFLEVNLINMYAKCQQMVYARQMLAETSEPGVVAWTAVIAGYVQAGESLGALRMFSGMRREGIWPNEFTFSCLFRASATLNRPWIGQQIHSFSFKLGLISNVYVSTSLLDVYAKCGCIHFARKVFDEMPERNLVSVNALLAGYADAGHGMEALDLFVRMRSECFEGNWITYSSLINACVGFCGIGLGRQLQALVLKNGLYGDPNIGASLVDLYSRFGLVKSAVSAFEDVTEKCAILWSSLIAAYVQNGNNQDAVRAFIQMLREGISGTGHTFCSLLKACASLAGFEQGRQIHTHALKTTSDSEVFVGSALVDMYAKTGSIEDASKVFQRMSQRNTVSWNAMLAGYAHHGHAEKALQSLQNMERDGLQPNYVTFLCLLSACSHAGLVDKGKQYFKSMIEDYRIEPVAEHYACMVDLLSRSGLLQEAEDFMRTIPIHPTASMYGSLLAASRIHGNMDLGRRSAERLIELDPNDSGTPILLCNIYAAAGQWEDAEKVRCFMKRSGLKKEPGCSWVEVKDKVHLFHANESDHPLVEQIYGFLQKLSGQMREAGYVPGTNVMLLDLEQQQECCLPYHSEMLALAFGLMSLPPGRPIRILKNLRICVNCHNSIKFIAGIVDRDIVVRDTNRFHHFNANVCSCKDYW